MDRRGRTLNGPFSGRRIRTGLTWVIALSVIPLSFAFGSFQQLQKYDEARGTLQTISDRAAIEGAWVYFTSRNISEAERKIASEEEVGKILHRWESSQDRVENVVWKVSADPIQRRFDLDVMADSPQRSALCPLSSASP